MVCLFLFAIELSTYVPWMLVINYFGPKMYEGLGLDAAQSLLVQGIYGWCYFVLYKTKDLINFH